MPTFFVSKLMVPKYILSLKTTRTILRSQKQVHLEVYKVAAFLFYIRGVYDPLDVNVN